jgi:hypothetical protein
MTRDDIIRMAQDAGLYSGTPRTPSTGRMIEKRLERFAALVAAAEREKHRYDIHSCGPTCERYACIATREAVKAEREACAKIVQSFDPYSRWSTLCNHIADIIRARGQA